jgi:hypothetical protein
MAFEGTEPIRSNIVIDNMILEQVNTFTYWAVTCNIKKRERHTFQNRKIFTNIETFK